ncbi:MAG: invasion associated locus B family protein [Hyphomicrobiaceae bacterium]
MKPFAFAIAVGSAILTTLTAAAQDTKLVDAFDTWRLYSHSGQPADICFITAFPRETELKRKEKSWFYVSAWPQEGVKSEVSVNFGKELQAGSTVTLQIGSSRYILFPKNDKAFISDPTQELKLIESMKRGNFMTISATTADGTTFKETYSLIGLTRAVNTLFRGCT